MPSLAFAASAATLLLATIAQARDQSSGIICQMEPVPCMAKGGCGTRAMTQVVCRNDKHEPVDLQLLDPAKHPAGPHGQPVLGVGDSPVIHITEAGDIVNVRPGLEFDIHPRNETLNQTVPIHQIETVLAKRDDCHWAWYGCGVGHTDRCAQLRC